MLATDSDRRVATSITTKRWYETFDTCDATASRRWPVVAPQVFMDKEQVIVHKVSQVNKPATNIKLIKGLNIFQSVPEGGWAACVHPGADLYVVLGTSNSRSGLLGHLSRMRQTLMQPLSTGSCKVLKQEHLAAEWFGFVHVIEKCKSRSHGSSHCKKQSTRKIRQAQVQDLKTISAFFLSSCFSLFWIQIIVMPGHFVPEGGWTTCVHPGADLYVVLGTSNLCSGLLGRGRNQHASKFKSECVKQVTRPSVTSSSINTSILAARFGLSGLSNFLSLRAGGRYKARQNARVSIRSRVPATSSTFEHLSSPADSAPFVYYHHQHLGRITALRKFIHAHHLAAAASVRNFV
ncbi:hypothetical protein CERSUDRAFT_72251 [Gelatoporia subvermispora B]|uniref:Uncharacterized protein n=1 Tax=Ceriporiopsis subvermispora (strain B) TaxID=914234 RepID=M2RJP2_CERS8|nr:hypothetical protein CERSUDRAFT_72251 [Gelatoporia subvermispora B]